MMKAKTLPKVLKQTTLLFLAMSTSSISAVKYIDKNYFAKRPENENLPLAITMHNKFLEGQKNIIKGTLQAAPFLEISSNGSNLADYLMLGDGNKQLSVGRNKDIDNRYFKFNESNSTNLTGDLSIKPKSKTWGLYLAYHQPLTKISKHLLLRVNIPIVQVRCDPRLKIKTNIESSESSKSISDYFQGEVMFEGTDANGNRRIMQEALEYGKISRATVKKTGVADVNIELNRRILQSGQFLFNLNALLTLPTNSPPRAEWLLEPTIGTAGHWGLGLGADGCYKFDDYLQLIYDIRYKYLIKTNERRILGLKDQSGNKLKLAQYMLFGIIGSPRVAPAANTLAQRVEVNPSGRFEFLAMFSYNKDNLLGQIGYDLWYKQKDKVKKVRSWENNSYAFPGSDYVQDIVKILSGSEVIQNQADFTVQHSNVDNTIAEMKPAGTTGTIQSSQLDLEAAESPSVNSQKIFASIGYSWDKKEISYYLGTGGSLEFPSNNSGLRGFGLWIKGGIVF